jgi:hypothetical protein
MHDVTLVGLGSRRERLPLDRRSFLARIAATGTANFIFTRNRRSFAGLVNVGHGKITFSSLVLRRFFALSRHKGLTSRRFQPPSIII